MQNLVLFQCEHCSVALLNQRKCGSIEILSQGPRRRPRCESSHFSSKCPVAVLYHGLSMVSCDAITAHMHVHVHSKG